MSARGQSKPAHRSSTSRGAIGAGGIVLSGFARSLIGAAVAASAPWFGEASCVRRRGLQLQYLLGLCALRSSQLGSRPAADRSCRAFTSRAPRSARARCAPPTVPRPPAASDATPEPQKRPVVFRWISVGSAVSSLPARICERQQVRNAADALRSLPGVAVSQQGSVRQSHAVRIRGAEGQSHAGRDRRHRGQPTTDGELRLRQLSVRTISSASRLCAGRRAGSTAQRAIGGVVSIIDQIAARAAHAQPENRGWHARHGIGDGALSGGNDTAWGSRDRPRSQYRRLQHLHRQATRATAPRIRSFAARGGIALSETFKIEGTLREHNTRADFDQGFWRRAEGVRRAHRTQHSSGDARLRVGSLQATLDTFNKTWTHNVYVQGTETAREDLRFVAAADEHAARQTSSAI